MQVPLCYFSSIFRAVICRTANKFHQNQFKNFIYYLIGCSKQQLFSYVQLK
jgi:lipid-A-disaccharide synthase-like uncharacterized protein